jgi:TRAP-type mannitol/chloroaromatic compound transport system substrate-binding protein
MDVLPAGAVVPAFQMQDAVHAGILDAGHGVCAYWYGKHKAFSLFGTPPSYGWDAHSLIAWFYYGGGEALYNELINDILKLNVVGLPLLPDADPAARLVQEADHRPSDLKDLKYRTVGLAADLFNARWAPPSPSCPAARSCRRSIAA